MNNKRPTSPEKTINKITPISPIFYMSKPTSLFVEHVEKLCNYNTGQIPVEYIYTHFIRPVYDMFPRLKLVICPCTGIQHLYPIPEQIKIINLNNRQFLYRNIWSTSEWTCKAMTRLLEKNQDSFREKTIGVIGAGRIGQQLHKLLEHYNCKILYHDVLADIIPLELNVVKNLDELLSKSDIITVHLASEEKTKNYISVDEFEKMKKKPLIINCSRSSIVNGPDLLRAYKERLISGFALDVIEDYDVYTTSEIYRLSSIETENVYMTEHIAGKGLQSRRLTDFFVAKEFEEYLKQEELL